MPTFVSSNSVNINAQFNHDIGQIYVNHYHWLVRKLCKKLSCPQRSADLAQDTFLKLIHKRSNLDEIIEPRAYLTTIAHGLMVNQLRRSDMENAYLAALATLGESEGEIFANPETFALILEKLTIIDHMLEGLPVKVRTAFLMHKLDGLSYSEIADKMGLSVISIKKYIAKALLHCASAR